MMRALVRAGIALAAGAVVATAVCGAGRPWQPPKPYAPYDHTGAAAVRSIQADSYTTPDLTPYAPYVTYGKKYSHTWTFVTDKLHRCEKINLSGTITWTNQWIKPCPKCGGVGTAWWHNIELRHPTISVTVFHQHARKPTCAGHADLSKINLQQGWTGYACSFNPGISFTYPWGISLSGWPSCGQRNQASYSTEPTKRTWLYHQYNSGSPAGFEEWNASGFSPPKQGPCYGGYPSTVAYVGGASDSFGAGNIKHSLQICLPWH